MLVNFPDCVLPLCPSPRLFPLSLGPPPPPRLLPSSAHSFSPCLPQLCGRAAKPDSFDLSAVHVVEIWGLLHCQATGPVMEHWRRRISHCSWCSWWMDGWREGGREGGREGRREGGRELELSLKVGRSWLLVNTSSWGQSVNPSRGSSGGGAAWETFTVSGCRDVSEALSWFPGQKLYGFIFENTYKQHFNCGCYKLWYDVHQSQYMFYSREVTTLWLMTNKVPFLLFCYYWCLCINLWTLLHWKSRIFYISQFKVTA